MNALFSDLGLCDPEIRGVPLPAKRLTLEHSVTNRFCHDYHALSTEESRTATFNFLELYRAVG